MGNLNEIRDYKQAFHQKILERLDRQLNVSREQLARQVGELIDKILDAEPVPEALSKNRDELKRELMQNVLGLGPIEDLLEDDTVDEIMINTHRTIYVERSGKLEPTDRFFLDERHLRTVIDRMLREIGKAVNEVSPYVDGRLRDGSRINVVIPPLALDGPLITIRKFKAEPLTIEDLIARYETITEELATFLKVVVRNRKNLVISGGSGSGKTTLLNVLSAFIPANERIITIEDSAELQLNQPHVGRLETRAPNFEGKGDVSIRDLVRNALRMRPDRIVVGECRGGEAIDMLQAMNTGHDGSLTTVHANSPLDVLSRLETMVTMAGLDIPTGAIRKQIAAAVDLIIHVARLGDGSRKVVRVSEVLGIQDNEIILQDLFEYRKDYISKEGEILGKLEVRGNIPSFLSNLIGEERDLFHELFLQTQNKEFE